MVANTQQRGLLRLAGVEARPNPAPTNVNIGRVELPDTGAEQAFASVSSSASSVAGELAKFGKEVGVYADHAAKVEGEKAGRQAGLDPEFRPTGQMTIRGEAFDRAGMDVYKTNAKIEIEADIEKGGDLGAKQRAWAARVPEEMRPEVDHMFRRAGFAKAREESRAAAARASSEATAALQNDVDRQTKGLHQRAYALGLDDKSDEVLAKDLGLYEASLRRAGPDGKPLVTPEAAQQLMRQARETVNDARLLGAFSRLPTVEAKEAFLAKLDEDFKGSAGIAQHYDFRGFQRIQRQLEGEMRSSRAERGAQTAAVVEDIKAAGKLAQKGYPLSPDQIAGFRARATSSPDPTLTAQVDQLEELASFQTAARRSQPAELDAYAANLREQMRVRGPNERAAARVELAEKLAEEARKQLKSDPLGWAERVGLMKIAPLDVSSPENALATFRARIAQAEEIGKTYGQAPVYLRPEEKRRIAHAASQGGAAMIGVAEAISKAAGDKSAKVLGEIFDDAPVVAMLGGHVAAVGKSNAAADVADGIALQRTQGFKGIAPSVGEAREAALQVHGGALSRLPQSEAAAINMANAAYEVRARRLGVTEFSPDLWKQTFREVLGERKVGGDVYGGVTKINGGQVVVPPNVKRDGGVQGLIAAIRPEDFGDAPPVYTDGRAAAIADIRRATPVPVGNGQYQLNLGSREAPRYLQGQDGQPYVLDLGALEGNLKPRRPDLYEGGGEAKSRRGTLSRPAGEMRLGGPMDDVHPVNAPGGTVDVNKLDTPGGRALWQQEMTRDELGGFVDKSYPYLRPLMDHILKEAQRVVPGFGEKGKFKWGYSFDPDVDMRPRSMSRERWNNFMDANDLMKRLMERAPGDVSDEDLKRLEKLLPGVDFKPKPPAGASEGAPVSQAPLPGRMGLFGGQKAATADEGTLGRAEQMATSGASRDEIWKSTGWMRGSEGRWRFEIDDSKAKLSAKPAELPDNARLGDLLDHGPLYEAYPHLRDIPVRVVKGKTLPGGAYGVYEVDRQGQARITIADQAGQLDEDGRPQMLATLLHEAQHAVQKFEGFDYRRGREPEARNTEVRRALSPERRRELTPWESQQITEGPIVGMPPEINQALAPLLDKLSEDDKRRLDDVLFSDHVLAGVEAIENARDEKGRARIASRLAADIKRQIGR